MNDYTKGEVAAMRKMAPLYTVEIVFSDEDDGYIATVSALPGCSAFGETRAEAAGRIDDAIAAWIAARSAMLASQQRSEAGRLGGLRSVEVKKRRRAPVG